MKKFLRSIRRKGSALLLVLGAISVLAIIVFFFFKAGSSRRFTTRMMSDEKKAEALAESAVDLVMGYIREKMNDEGSADYYFPFRYPCDLPTGDIGDGDGKNIPLDMANYSGPFLDMEGAVGALEPLKYIVDELGGEDNVKKLKVSISVPYAEALSAKKDTYEVVGISERSTPAGGASAEIYDSYTNLVSPPSDNSLSSINSDWTLDFKMPNHTYTDSHKIYIDVGFWSFIVDIEKQRVTASRLNPSNKDELKIYITLDIKVTNNLTGSTVYRLRPTDPDGNKTIDVPQKLEGYIKLGEGETNLTMRGIRKQAMDGDSEGTGLVWKASKLAQEINNEWSGLSPLIKGKIKSEPFGTNPQVVEKTGVLQIKAEVEYYPNGPSGKLIEKTLIANRPFKVSDVQPPAPEYSLFIANSDLIFEEDDNPMGLSLGDAIDWAPGVASICIHNLPDGEYDKLSGLEGSSLSEGKLAQVPGMVRINSRSEMKINTFLGTVRQPHLTEFNALVNKYDISSYKVLPTFRWNDSPTPNSQYTVEFPVIKDTALLDVWPCTGFAQVLNFLENCDALNGPTLFFGDCFIEYPLGMCLEAKMKQRYGTVVFQVKPCGQQDDPKDVSEIRITYLNKEKKYGIKGKEAYDTGAWSPDNQNCKPANLYSLLQYAKKATHFYKSEADFWADTERFTGGVYDCTGVTYIKGSLNIDTAPEFKVKGKGILVVKDNIVITKNVRRADTDTVFSLIARAGYMEMKDGCDFVEASCYSNSSPIFDKTSKIEINGNLVVNEFRRETIDFMELNYNSAACRVSPLSVMRDVGKFDPKRYIVSVADNWSSYKFAKK